MPAHNTAQALPLRAGAIPLPHNEAHRGRPVHSFDHRQPLLRAAVHDAEGVASGSGTVAGRGSMKAAFPMKPGREKWGRSKGLEHAPRLINSAAPVHTKSTEAARAPLTLVPSCPDLPTEHVCTDVQ
jgi:hypothetical protein